MNPQYAINGRIFVESYDTNNSKRAYEEIHNFLCDALFTLKKEPTQSSANKNKVFSTIKGLHRTPYQEFLVKIDKITDQYKPFEITLNIYKYVSGGQITSVKTVAKYRKNKEVSIMNFTENEKALEPSTYNLQNKLKLEGAVNLSEEDSFLPYLINFAKNYLTGLTMGGIQQHLLSVVRDLRKIQFELKNEHEINQIVKIRYGEQPIYLTYASFDSKFYDNNFVQSLEFIREKYVHLLIETEVGNKLKNFKDNFEILKKQYAELEEFIDTSEYIKQDYKDKIFKDDKLLNRMSALIEFIEKELPYK